MDAERLRPQSGRDVKVDVLCLHALRARAATNALEHEADIARHRSVL